MRILVSTPTFLPVIGGAELGIHEIYKRVAKHHDVTIITAEPPQALVDNYGALDYTEAAYKVHYLHSKVPRRCPKFLAKRLEAPSAISYLLRLARLSMKGRADVINFHFVRPHGPALIILRRWLHVPVVLSLVGRSDVLRLNPWYRRFFANRIVQNADAVLPISPFYLRGTSARNIQVIPYGVDTTIFTPHRRSNKLRESLGISPNDFMLLSVQRLAPVKRVDVLIRMTAELVVDEPAISLVIIGQGEEDARLRALVAELKLEHHVKLLGYIGGDDLPGYFASSDVFVFHSMFETFGIVFAQAMAAGLPIVAARTSCVPDVVGAENGILFEPFCTSAFCNAVRLLKTNQTLRTAMKEQNRQRATSEFDWDRIAKRYEAVMRDTAKLRRADPHPATPTHT
jgi:glycosyltransferase involved in cell wall biosynthesis